MTGQENAKAGNSNIAGIDLDAAWEGLSGLAGTARTPEDESPRTAPSTIAEDHQSTDSQLYAYLHRATAPRPGGFPPLDQLSARLGELEPSSRDTGASAEGAQKTAEGVPENNPGGGLDWFEHRFSELRQLLTPREDNRKEIAAINAKLSDIVWRIDKISAAMPAENTMTAVETQLRELSGSLERTREQTAADADRISRAAIEILAATDKAQQARAGFERAANHAVKELGHTVTVTASRAAILTAEHIKCSMWKPDEQAGILRLEKELRVLNANSRESGERTEAALERVNTTLRDYLERPGKTAPPQPYQPRKRTGIHVPISADAPAYTRTSEGFGAEPAQKPQLDTITLRTPQPSDPNLIKALEEAEAKLDAGKGQGLREDTQRERMRDKNASIGAPFFREEEKNLPLIGLAIVAIVLLLASAALFYLHTKPHLVSLQAPKVQVAEAVTYSVVDEPQTSQTSVDKTAPAPLQAEPASYQSLFTAAGQDTSALGVQPGSAGEDLKTLESAARRGEAAAQFRIALRFLNDGGLIGGAGSAARWLARAADQGHTEAQFVLASLYERGEGVRRDEKHALELYRKAAAAGHIKAMHNLGVLLTARGTAEDYREAAEWFTRAASDLPESQYNLALLYERGLGIEQNLSKAYYWYQLAARGGDKEAMWHAEQLKHLLVRDGNAGAPDQSWSPSLEDRRSGSVRG
ncbi:MAG: hypothetical protein WBX25_05880 [Rhodomicrobium sp.]